MWFRSFLAHTVYFHIYFICESLLRCLMYYYLLKVRPQETPGILLQLRKKKPRDLLTVKFYYIGFLRRVLFLQRKSPQNIGSSK